MRASPDFFELFAELLERERRAAVDSMSEAQQHELAQRDTALREAEYARAIAEERMANLATHSKAAASYQSLCHQLDVATATGKRGSAGCSPGFQHCWPSAGAPVVRLQV